MQIFIDVNTVMEPFKYNYSNNELGPVDIDEFFGFYQQYKSNHPAGQQYLIDPEHEINVLAILENSDYLTLDNLLEQLPNTEIRTHISTVLEHVRKQGITKFKKFSIWLHGNHPNLPTIKQLSGHTHEDPARPLDQSCKVYTMIYPLHITEPVADTIWSVWIDDINSTRPGQLKDMRVASFMNSKIKSFEVRFIAWRNMIKAMRVWWDSLRVQTKNTELKLLFPAANQQLTLEFNASSWLHGVENIQNNLYLIVLLEEHVRD